MTEQQLKEYLTDIGYEDSILFENPSYITAVTGVSETGRIIYDYNKMIEYLVSQDEMTEEDAIEFIDYNTIRALPYAGENAPIIMYGIDENLDIKLSINEKEYKGELIAEKYEPTWTYVYRIPIDDNITSCGFSGDSMVTIKKEFPDIEIPFSDTINYVYIIEKPLLDKEEKNDLYMYQDI